MKTQRLFWCVPLAFALHVAEELTGGFPAWASRHFASMTTLAFAVGNGIGVGMFAYLAYGAVRFGGRWIWFLMAAQWALFLNAGFHIGTTLLFGEYSPGVITNIVLYLPLTFWLITRLRRSGALTPPTDRDGNSAGCALHGGGGRQRVVAQVAS